MKLFRKEFEKKKFIQNLYNHPKKLTNEGEKFNKIISFPHSFSIEANLFFRLFISMVCFILVLIELNFIPSEIIKAL